MAQRYLIQNTHTQELYGGVGAFYNFVWESSTALFSRPMLMDEESAKAALKEIELRAPTVEVRIVEIQVSKQDTPDSSSLARLNLETFAQKAGVLVFDVDDPEVWDGKYGWYTKDAPNCRSSGYASRYDACYGWAELTFGKATADELLNLLSRVTGYS